MWKVVVITLNVLLAVGPDQIGCAVSIGLGPCPDEHKPGDVWYPPGCNLAHCYDGSYTIVSCGVVYIEHDPNICYIHYNRTLTYPHCCVPELLCIGDIGFEDIYLVG